MGKFQTKKGQVLESELAKYMIMQRINSKEQLRQLTTVGSNVTMLKCMDDPESMRIGTLIQIMSGLRIPKEDRLKIISQLFEI